MVYIPLTATQGLSWLARANRVAERAMAMGRHPFGAVLIAPGGEVLLAEQGNINTTHHAESTLARHASDNWPNAYLAGCTLVTTFEPCAMCAGTIYWAGIGGVLYGATETDLLALTGNHPENPTLSLPCREVFARGQRQVVVQGPVPQARQDLLGLHQGFWAQRGL